MYGNVRSDPQLPGPRFKWSTTAFVAVEERKIGHGIRDNELVFTRRQLRLTMQTTPGTAIEIDLIQDITVGIAGVKWNRFRDVRMSVNDMASAAVPEILFGKRVLVVRTVLAASQAVHPGVDLGGPAQ